MARRRRSLGFLVLVMLIGAIGGTVVGEALGILIGRFFSGSVVEKLLLACFTYEFPPATLPLVIASISVGFTIKFNVMSLLGIAVAAYYFRWYQ